MSNWPPKACAAKPNDRPSSIELINVVRATLSDRFSSHLPPSLSQAVVAVEMVLLELERRENDTTKEAEASIERKAEALIRTAATDLGISIPESHLETWSALAEISSKIFPIAPSSLEERWCAEVAQLENEKAAARKFQSAAASCDSESTLNREQLQKSVRAHSPWPTAEISSYRTLSGGFSRETLAVMVEHDNLSEEIILRVEKPGGIAHGISLSVAEERPLLDLSIENGVPAPPPLWTADDDCFSGAYLAMRKMPGSAIETLSPDLNGIEEERFRKLAALMVHVHQLPWQTQATKIGVAFRLSDPTSLSTADAQRIALSRWKAYWDSGELEPSPLTEMAYRWLCANIPHRDVPLAITHGDLNFRNIMFDETEAITALLDWELAALSDPARDLAQAKPIVSPVVPWDKFLQWYIDAGGTPVDNETFLYYEIFSNFTYLLGSKTAIDNRLLKIKPSFVEFFLLGSIGVALYTDLLRESLNRAGLLLDTDR